LTWATRAAEGERSDRFYLDEWIDLHAIPAFESFVGWLRGQLDAVGPTLSPTRQREVARLFERTVELEVAFFDAAYE
jgi:thiaminase/transcriptional activator TenA